MVCLDKHIRHIVIKAEREENSGSIANEKSKRLFDILSKKKQNRKFKVYIRLGFCAVGA